MNVVHDRENHRFTMDVKDKMARVDYSLKNHKMYLVYSEVPFEFRGRGYGKKLVEGTFEKLTAEGYKAVAVCSYIKAVSTRSAKWQSIIG